MEKKYSNNDITVTWKPDMCEHSTKCWKGLLPVFDPRKKPWVNMQGASTDDIIKQVSQCPSGALSFVHNSGEKPEAVEDYEIVEVNVAPMGPTRLRGNFVIKDREGNVILEGQKAVSLCSCGHSNKKPFCDGMHKTLPGYIPPVK